MDWKLRVILAVMASAWGAVFFSLGLRLTFPSDAAKSFLVQQVDALSGGQYALRMDDVSPWWGTGLTLENAQVLMREAPKPRRRKRGGEEPEAEPEADPYRLLVELTEVSARLKPFTTLISRAPTFSLAANLYDGDIGGVVSQSGPITRIDVLGTDINLEQLPVDGETLKAKLAGAMRARIDLTIDAEEAKNTTGKVRFEVDGLRMSEASLMGFTLGEANFSEAVLSLNVEQGRAKVKKGSFVSDLVQVQIDGEVQLQSPLGRSRLRLDFNVKLAEELDKLARLAPGVKEARDAEGVLHFTCAGTLDSPDCGPEGARRGRVAGPLGAAGGEGIMGGDGGGEAEPMDAEERKRRREERLAERRERIRQLREQREANGGENVGEDPELTGPGNPRRPGPING
ncbi:type II secretion system protein GspN, partial [Myxococcota bacterium]|nr:type II secretion system protein GspN [Myxococcota bacterium]